VFVIDYNEKTDKFNLFFKDIPNENFEHYVNLLKSWYMKWSVSDRVWEYDIKRADEFQLWFNKNNIETTYSQKALDKINEIKQSYRHSELVIDRNITLDESILTPDTKLFEFQKEDIKYCLYRNRVWNCNAPGLGKSLESIFYFTTLYVQNKIDKILIIPPIGMSYHWKYEILKFVNVFKEEDIAIIENKNKLNIFADNIDKKIIIISNHLLADAILYYKKSQTKSRSKKQIRWKKFVDIKQEWNAKNLFLLVDESHNEKYLSAIKTKALQSILSDFNYRTFCTATPFINRFEHVYANATMLDKSLIPMSENAFKIWLSDFIGDQFGAYNIKSYNQKNVSVVLDTLKNTLFLKRNKEDIPEMKTKRFVKTIYLSMTSLQKELYYAIMKEELQKLEQEFDKITWKLVLQKLHMIFACVDNPEILKKNVYDNDRINQMLNSWSREKDPKLQMLDYKINEYVEENDEKLIVFCQHPYNLDMFYERYKKYNPIVIHGSTEGKDKELLREKKRTLFNTVDSCKLAFLSFMTSSAGGNWNGQCHRMIHYSISPDATLGRQSIDRTARINSTEDSLIEIFCMPGTIDNLRYQRSMNRMDLNDKLGKEISDEELKNLLKGIL
jgi:hypothetical protein